MAKEFLDSSARINNTEKNTGRQGGKFSLGRFALRLLGSAGLMVSPLIVACAPDAKAVPPEATATFVPGGFGGPNPIATYTDSDSRAERLNPIIDRINAGDPTLTNDERNAVTLAGSADRTATVVGGTKPPVEGTQTPSQTEAPKGFDNGILSPEAYNKAEYVQWTNPNGTKSEGIGITLEKVENFRIPEDMQVATAELTRDSKPIGNMIIAVRKDGSQILILGSVTPVNIEKVGKNLPAGTVVAISGEPGLTYVDKYTQLLVLSAEDRNRLFPDQTKIPPKFITNTPRPQTTNQSNRGVTFFDVPPPKG